MNHIITRFLSYVEIRTKIASVLPFAFGIFYALYVYGRIIFLNTFLFFISMLFFDMATTALNNYIDTKTNNKPLQFEKKTAKLILFFLLLFAAAAGLVLVNYTGLTVLLSGVLCFLAGILYTFGPAPISRMPLGELFSGFFMGFFIPFIAVIVNAPGGSVVFIAFSGRLFSLYIDIAEIMKLFIVTFPPMAAIANIMLANNICDLEADIKADRFTLPYYIGRENSVKLFALLYAASAAAIIAAAVFRIFPPYILISLLSFPFVYKKVLIFSRRQSKEETFPLSVQNFIIIMLPLIVSAAIAALLK